MNSNKTAVVILNWNGRAYLEKYLPILLAYTPAYEATVYVADNASTDDSVAFIRTKYPQVCLLLLDKNYGFAEGYNLAIGKIESEYIVLLNSDVAVTENWLKVPLAYLKKHPRVAACQPKILQASNHDTFEFAGASGGYIDCLGYPFCRGRILTALEQDNGQYDTIQPIFWATGACLFVRRKDFVDYGGLDEQFFAHQEEIDLCWRFHARGRDVVVVPQSIVYHVGGGTLNVGNPHKTFLNFRNNLCLLYKNMPFFTLCLVWPIRFALDYIAALTMLAQGKKEDAISVCKARFAFYGMLPLLRPKRIENRTKSIKVKIPSIYRGSILWSYYVRKKRTFAQLSF